MDIQQLQLLAGRTRDLLQQSNHTIGHNQSLDLIAALPGLRNWPEVRAFPNRVAACELDESSAGRLAFRVKRKFGVELSTPDILVALSGSNAHERALPPEIWPSGPDPGVYIGTSLKAIESLLQKYEEATDGALMYGEHAASGWEGCINLGDYGLWSGGLNRVPSGTLIVVGPISLNQSEWKDSSERLEMACLSALNSGHRVAVLVETQSPESLYEDLDLMVREVQGPDGDSETALVGVVSEEGELRRRTPFAGQRTTPIMCQQTSSADGIPEIAARELEDAFARRTTGLLLFGSSTDQEHCGMDLVAASLPLTDHLGPIARIRPRNRSTPAKDWLVPDRIKEIPFLPSIQSAYESGYRRMIIHPGHTEGDLVLEYGSEVLFIAGAYGTVAEELCLEALRANGFHRELELMSFLIAALGVTTISATSRQLAVSDLYVAPENQKPKSDRFLEILEFVNEKRVIKWETAIGSLLDSGEVTAGEIEQAIGRDSAVRKFLAARGLTEQVTM